VRRALSLHALLTVYSVLRGGGYGVLGLRQINTCRKVPLQVHIWMMTFCIVFYESYLSTEQSHEIWFRIILKRIKQSEEGIVYSL
jgi:hypothetical protein